MVAMARTSHGSPVVGSRVETFCSSEANFISSIRSRLLFSFSPSLPRPTVTPAARRAPMRAGPEDSFMLEQGQWATAVPVWASSSISRSSSHTQWAMTVRGPRMPRRNISSMGRAWKRVRDSWTSQMVSEEWVWMPVSNSSARSAAARNASGVQ